MESNTLPLIVAGLLAIAIVVHAYNMGWQAGHDIHHSDDVQRPDAPPPPPPEVPTLWR